MSDRHTSTQNAVDAYMDRTVREARAQERAALAGRLRREARDGYFTNTEATWADGTLMNMDGRIGAGFALEKIATELESTDPTDPEEER